ncbi:shikimate dehydrogenase [Bacillus sp. PS06]|uniref:shikimate dehydrogenase n=1 Tax=Bacillus sp. PS06 TaxID=2764176 RepID=UPI0017863D9D|nr:shikimate dehydrogenase [Bacillus sp. PS06]MBD8069226.1 shikimate dehydrogenase [Bacillus sp. PS06]
MEKIYGVIGDPIAHSMSPDMHNDLFQFYNLHARYHAFHVKQEHLRDAIKGFKAIGLSGFNVTIPHKVAILEMLDEVEEVAANIGAVNTVVNENGKLVGYNTDGQGYITSLMTKIKKELKECQVLIIGAGGAARGIYISLAAAGVKTIDIVNRTAENADKIIASCRYKTSSSYYEISGNEYDLTKYDIIINTTSIGMHPNIDQTPIPIEQDLSGTVVSDIIYNPLETSFLKDAQRNGAIIDNGIGMFVYQGALAFEKWTGIFPDPARMERVVRTRLGGTT